LQTAASCSHDWTKGGGSTTTTALNIGHQVNFSSLFGHMKKLSYWPQRLINNETQSFSK
jgi:hypothetical protein